MACVVRDLRDRTWRLSGKVREWSVSNCRKGVSWAVPESVPVRAPGGLVRPSPPGTEPSGICADSYRASCSCLKLNTQVGSRLCEARSTDRRLVGPFRQMTADPSFFAKHT
jgi:hypothetical protein